MHLPKDFISGFASAVHSLGQEGDHRNKDWSEPYKYLKEMLATFEPEKPKEVLGFKFVVSDSLPPDSFEFHHADGRVERFTVKSGG